jgi:diacylglycerol kinase family enzyme
MKTVALLNPAAGGVSPQGPELMKAALLKAGLSGAEIVTVDPDSCEDQLRTLASGAPDLFIVWGGDGTLRSALSTVGQKTPNLLLLPGGTMNLLTKSIHGDKPWDEIMASVVKAPRKTKLQAGKVSGGEVFYCAMMAGAPARFAEARESLRRGDIASVVTEARAALDTLQSVHLKTLYGEGAAPPAETLPTTSILGALVGPLSNSGRMEVAALEDANAIAALNVVWSSFISDWRSAPGVKVVVADRLVIESEDGDDIPVIIDGEAIEAGPRIDVEFVEEAAQCLTAS